MEDSHSGEEMCAKIAQLEAERRELQVDFEALCRQQTGGTGAIDVMARMQARRSVFEEAVQYIGCGDSMACYKEYNCKAVDFSLGVRTVALEQELTACRHKVASLTVDYADLQREFATLQKSKEDTTLSVKIELEKVRRVENDVLFYQTQVIAALSERDEALLEVETLQEDIKAAQIAKEDLESKMKELELKYSQLQEVEAQKTAQLGFAVDLTNLLGKALLCVWKELRSVGKSCSLEQEGEAVEPATVAAIVLNEASNRPLLAMGQSKGQQCTEPNDSNVTFLEKELEEIKVEITRAREEAKESLEAVASAREDAENSAMNISTALADLSEQLFREVNEFRIQQRDARSQVHLLLSNGLESLTTDGQHLLRQVHASLEQRAIGSRCEAEALIEAERDRGVRSREALEEQLRCTSHALAKAEERLIGYQVPSETMELQLQAKATEDDERRDIFAQAMQEKVAALLLLSQQEERHHLEVRSMTALQEQLNDLRLKLSQVVEEKVNALMLVANLRAQINDLEHHHKELEQQLNSQQTTSMAGRMITASWLGASPTPLSHHPSNPPSNVASPLPSQGLSPVQASSIKIPPARQLVGSYLSTWIRSSIGREDSPSSSNKGPTEVSDVNQCARARSEWFTLVIFSIFVYFFSIQSF